ncbi:MAG: hypothetical protein JO263_00535 [Candidatus Eremiobacteraeota bacterium]|nr:hypothetical protein [Candidatus Eremiobacteraeota bacterium]
MDLPKRMLVSTVALAMAVLCSASTALAQGLRMEPMARTYSGPYPVTVTGTQHGSFAGCLTLSTNGFATLVIGTEKFTYGTYSVVNGLFVATIQAQGYGQNAGLLFMAPATRILGQGFFEEVYGGENFQSGALAFGVKGRC